MKGTGQCVVARLPFFRGWDEGVCQTGYYLTSADQEISG